MARYNQCMHCGACCAAFRISFDNHELNCFQGGVVPVELTCRVSATRAAMQGTDKRPFRCLALVGHIGRNVNCSIYTCRPTTCREFMPAGDDHQVNPLCDQARAWYGLSPLGGF